jgi:heme exporter protein D
MIELGPHAVFIVTGYAGVLVAVVALIFLVAYQSRAVKARLAALEAQGVRRRSAGTAP